MASCLIAALAGCGETTQDDAGIDAGCGPMGCLNALCALSDASCADAGDADAGDADAETTDAETADAAAGDADVANDGGIGYCPGHAPDPSQNALPRCSVDADCRNVGMSRMVCSATEPVYEGCGGPIRPELCVSDGDCGPDGACEPGECGGTICRRRCPAAACSATQDCVDGRCADRRCDLAGAAQCPAGFRCVPGPLSDERGCAPVSCTEGYVCPESLDCVAGAGADAHGCLQRSCETFADCDCGSCVNRVCRTSPGFCYVYSPPL